MAEGEHVAMTVARTMRAIRLPRAGGPDQLVLEEIETRLRTGEALVKVHAAAIRETSSNGWSIGFLRSRRTSSGVVMAVAPDVTRLLLARRCSRSQASTVTASRPSTSPPCCLLAPSLAR
jgi:NADPH:quinone reductase-like Zn-dependent oxidoreductase